MLNYTLASEKKERKEIATMKKSGGEYVRGRGIEARGLRTRKGS